MSTSQTILSASLAIIGGAVLAMLAERHIYRRWRADRQERQWDQAITMARVVDNPEEPEMVRALARSRLESLGVTQEWLGEVRAAQHRQLAGGLFKTHPEMSADDADAIDRAIAEPADGGDRIRDVSAAVDRIVKYSLEAEAYDPHADRKIRITILVVLFGATFAALALASIYAAVR